MLRRWPQRGLASPPAALRLQASQRAFWSQAMELIKSHLNPGNAITSVDKEGGSDAESRASSRIAGSAWRPQVPDDVRFPEFLQDAGDGQVACAKTTFTGFAHHLRRTSDPAQAWDVVKQCRPFVVERNGIRLADAAASDEVEPSDVLQMLPADLFAERSAGSNCRAMFVGATGLEGPQGTITAANEAVVVALLVQKLHFLGKHGKAIALFEGYNRERKKWLNERSALETSADAEKEAAAFDRVTRLWSSARAAYLKSLLFKSRYHRIVQFAREDSRNLDVACESVATMTSLLIGCRKQKDSALARLAIDTMSKQNPVTVLPLTIFELAFKSAIQNKNRDEDDLDNALWIARVMRDDAGYILQPDLWFALFNTSLHLKREESALEVFGMYSSNFTSLHQNNFRRALRKACRLNHPDVVLTMVRQWLATIDNDVDAAAKAEAVSFVLGEMLSSRHPISAITEMLAIMESSQIEASNAVLQRVATTILDDASSRLSPHETIKNSLEFWKVHSPTVQNSVFIMHVLIQQCLKRDWLDECELVVNEIAERRLPGVPCNSIVKAMTVNEERGRFENNVRMCKVLLKSLSRPGFRSLNKQFFELYLKALLCLGRFGEVREQHARLKLGKRYPKSAPLAVALRDAKAQQK
ncbi:hypothetical protein PF005_g13406 [Phytophthora fragariae]|uniref:Uncharacterized protein n=1 Tax=Phytophthora fragariae TaxID=53985 RepID=A0A6A3TUV3_9STRA|nr:hypothetical protein PF003_g37841 [Phytophthora fragariae]KAE8935370.1 hypothetical protein PF009_g14686 [Phytophthora fragariae]KAE9004646.1 hypothetical protein PF011_g12356 [Phytophthora fragariae]KAE9105031.1 hypothetical protein PF007_g13840 [Phytophthora fragariae]KAE9106171.1 hypothetical protein PF010_g12711 [Phytophthora fragariae]